jgi:TonB family protein
MKSTVHAIDRDREYSRSIRLAGAASLALVLVGFLVAPEPLVRPYAPRLAGQAIDTLIAWQNPVSLPDPPKPLRAKLPIPSPDGLATDSGVGLNNWADTGAYVRWKHDVLDPVPYYKVEKKPELLRQVVPAYPDMARSAGIEGRVVVQVVVDTLGRVARAEVLAPSGSRLLDESALAAAQQFEFRPGYQLDRPVPVTLSIPFRFQLQ